MVRYMPLIVVALIIDGLKALVYWACFGLGAGIEALPIVGQVAGMVSIPLGIGLGIALSICLSITLGSGFLLLLAYNDLFYLRYAIGGGFAGIVPGIDILPGWTSMTVLCIIRKNKEEGLLEGTATGAFDKLLSPKTAVGAAFRAVKAVDRDRVTAMQERGIVADRDVRDARIETRQRIKTDLQNIDGITPHPKTSSVIPNPRHA